MSGYQIADGLSEMDFSEPEDERLLTELAKVYFPSSVISSNSTRNFTQHFSQNLTQNCTQNFSQSFTQNITQDSGYVTDQSQSHYYGSSVNRRSTLSEIQNQLPNYLSQSQFSQIHNSSFSGITQLASQSFSSKLDSQFVFNQSTQNQDSLSQVTQNKSDNSQLLVWKMDKLPLPSQTCSLLAITDDLVPPLKTRAIRNNKNAHQNGKLIKNCPRKIQQNAHLEIIQLPNEQVNEEKQYLKIDALRLSLAKNFENFAAYRASIPQLYRLEVIEKLEFLKKSLEGALRSQTSNKTLKAKGKMENVKKSDQIIRQVTRKSIIYDDLAGLTVNETNKKYKKLNAPQMHLYISLLEKLIQAVQSNTYSTSRDLYYKVMEQFKTVTRVQSFLIDIYTTLKVTHLDLHIIARPAGFVYGNLTFIDKKANEDTEVYCKMAQTGLCIPTNSRSIEFKSSDARFILIVEKQSTFDHLAGSSMFELFKFIMITGCGYPCLSTREFLQKLWLTFEIPILALVDCDAFGFEIMCNYRFGSFAMAHENHSLRVPDIFWLGVLPEEVRSLQLPGVPFSDYEKRRLDSIMHRDFIKQQKDWFAQLKIMKHLKKKVEIQALYSYSDSYLVDVYLPQKLSKGKWI